MKKTISFCLYGNDRKYWKGALENIRLSRIHYPGWNCRFYLSTDSPQELIEMIQKEDCQTALITPFQAHSCRLWRFYAADDSDIMICRDTDSRLSKREAVAVEDWLNSDKQFHIMRDHPLHDALIPAGMWGCRNTSGMKELVDGFPDQGAPNSDQQFLARYIYPQVKEHAMIHDSYDLFNDGIPFPTERIGDEFVGAAYDENGNII